MREADASVSHDAAMGKTVVLLLPEAMTGFANPAQLQTTLINASRPVRVLLFLPTGHTGETFAPMLAGIGVEAEILAGPGIAAPETAARRVQMPPDMSEKDQREFALALCDVVLVASRSLETAFTQNAKDLGKPIVAAGDPLPDIPPFESVTTYLDPDMRGWHARGRSAFGRLEQAIIEALAFNWLAPDPGGRAESRRRLRKCVGRWCPGSYFAPDSWRDLAPDRSAVEDSSQIVARFNALDRSAVHGSYIHRDLAWIAHFGAAVAVLIAVAGHLNGGAAWWGIAELVTLFIVGGLVLGARGTALQERWTACRLGAEQLRIARMSLPLLVLPPALATTDKPPSGHGHSKETELGFVALTEVKRVVRDHGLPRLAETFTPAEAAKWLHLIVDDQITYHHRNHRKLEHAEKRLLRITKLIFLSAIIAVVAHFIWHWEWLLVVTAAAPAFAAALHGTGTRLGIVHRAALSIDAERELTQIRGLLAGLIETPPAADDWREVRHLAFQAAQAMGRESTSWHGLVRRYRDELP